MATRLEIAENKLVRLEKECEEARQKVYGHAAQTNGQPMNDKRNGPAFFKKRDELENRVFAKMEEIEKQKDRISMLKDQEFKKKHNLTANYGLATCVQNIEELKARKQDKKTRQKVEMLENIIKKAKKDEQIMGEKARSLIASGAVKIWDKKPIYYFVKNLYKVALIVDDHGYFVVSRKYPTKDEKERDFVERMLADEE